MSSNFYQNLYIIYITNENFRADIQYIRENVPIVKLYVAGEGMEDHINSSESIKTTIKIKSLDDIHQFTNNYNKAVSDLRLKYHLSPAYQTSLKDFIEQRDIISYFGLSEELYPFNIENPSNPKEKFTVIRLNPETTITELQKNWNEIRQAVVRLSDSKPLKASPRVNVGRDLEIYQLRQNGKKDKEIASIINEKYPDKILGYQDIAKIVKRLLDYSKKLTGQAK
ncbi:MAG: hypothetical protein Q8Q67_00315 [bacterium]|nr:hypothetical protein [bacterium]